VYQRATCLRICCCADGGGALVGGWGASKDGLGSVVRTKCVARVDKNNAIHNGSAEACDHKTAQVRLS
jgi:hypothetical protein